VDLHRSKALLTLSQFSAVPSPSLQMQSKMMAYNRVVVELNAARLRDASFPVVHAFIQAALSLNPDVRVFDSSWRSFLFTLL
jgi:nuclear pore complex protein Nup93